MLFYDYKNPPHIFKEKNGGVEQKNFQFYAIFFKLNFQLFLIFRITTSILACFYIFFNLVLFFMSKQKNSP